LYSTVETSRITVLPCKNKVLCTDKKENQIAVAKSYIRKVFLIYEKMGKYFPIYEEAVSHI
jgi:hypothetical protein